MDAVTVIGIIASVFTAGSMLPQLIKVIQEKKAGMSLITITVLFIGLVIWTIYGILKKDWVITISNAFSAIISLSIGILTVKYKNSKKNSWKIKTAKK